MRRRRHWTVYHHEILVIFHRGRTTHGVTSGAHRTEGTYSLSTSYKTTYVILYIGRFIYLSNYLTYFFSGGFFPGGFFPWTLFPKIFFPTAFFPGNFFWGIFFQKLFLDLFSSNFFLGYCFSEDFFSGNFFLAYLFSKTFIPGTFNFFPEFVGYAYTPSEKWDGARILNTSRCKKIWKIQLFERY